MAAQPGGFGKTSPDPGGRTGISPGLQQLCKTGGQCLSPRPTRPPDIQVFFKNRKRKSTDVLKILMKDEN